MREEVIPGQNVKVERSGREGFPCGDRLGWRHGVLLGCDRSDRCANDEYDGARGEGR